MAGGGREAAPVLCTFCCVCGGTGVCGSTVPGYCRAQPRCCLCFLRCGGAEPGMGCVCCWGSRLLPWVLVSGISGMGKAAGVLCQVNDGEAAPRCRVCACVLAGQIDDHLWGRRAITVSNGGTWVPQSSPARDLCYGATVTPAQGGKGAYLHQPRKRNMGQRPHCLAEGMGQPAG